MFDHLLVPSDGSEDSVRAAQRARTIGEATGARVTLVHVIGELETGDLDLFGDREIKEKLESVKLREGRTILDETERHFEGSGVETAR